MDVKKRKIYPVHNGPLLNAFFLNSQFKCGLSFSIAAFHNFLHTFLTPELLQNYLQKGIHPAYI